MTTTRPGSTSKRGRQTSFDPTQLKVVVLTISLGKVFAQHQ